jgi:hypothetical protein
MSSIANIEAKRIQLAAEKAENLQQGKAARAREAALQKELEGMQQRITEAEAKDRAFSEQGEFLTREAAKLEAVEARAERKVRQQTVEEELESARVELRSAEGAMHAKEAEL